jgi:hypothetical protein
MNELNSGPGLLLRLAIWTALADSRPPPSMDKDALKEMMRKKIDEGEPNAREMLSNKTSILAYLSFPLLEGMTKLRCSDYVNLDGTVRQSFTVDDTPYGATKGKKRVNSLHDLMRLLHDYVADADEKQVLDSIRDSICQATGTDAYRQIYDWRNSHAHGVASLRGIGYTVYNLALLVSLHGIRDCYEEIRDDARTFGADVAERVGHGFSEFMPWHYYPPHWRDIPPGLAYLSTG